MQNNYNRASREIHWIHLASALLGNSNLKPYTLYDAEVASLIQAYWSQRVLFESQHLMLNASVCNGRPQGVVYTLCAI